MIPLKPAAGLSTPCFALHLFCWGASFWMAAHTLFWHYAQVLDDNDVAHRVRWSVMLTFGVALLMVLCGALAIRGSKWSEWIWTPGWMLVLLALLILSGLTKRKRLSELSSHLLLDALLLVVGLVIALLMRDAHFQPATHGGFAVGAQLAMTLAVYVHALAAQLRGMFLAPAALEPANLAQDPQSLAKPAPIKDNDPTY
jgi:hypothetical protein